MNAVVAGWIHGIFCERVVIAPIFQFDPGVNDVVVMYQIVA